MIEPYDEEAIKSFLKCPAFYRLDGKIYDFDPSQELLFTTLKDINLKLLKNSIVDFDQSLNKILKANILKFFPTMKSIDDTQYLYNWAIALVYDYFKLFPIATYSPLMTNHQPIVYFNSTPIRLNIDLMIMQNNKMKFLHIISLYPRLDLHNLNNDLFNSLKLKYLNEIYSFRKRGKSPVKIHCLSVRPASFRNRNERNYTLSKTTLSILPQKDSTRAEELLQYFLANNESSVIRPYCDDYKCSKRKECTYD